MNIKGLNSCDMTLAAFFSRCLKAYTVIIFSAQFMVAEVTQNCLLQLFQRGGSFDFRESHSEC